MPPALLLIFIACMHQFHFRAGDFLCCAGKTSVRFEAGKARPQIFAQAGGIVDQGCIRGGAGIDVTFQRLNNRRALLHRQLWESRSIVAGIFM